ncbi:uncharacterized protein UMAG_12264 [Mycosarcoma maydis]|uniref:Uncharacterized protein n=1 Tax=Mycosarcoma maydis TaxID=5270 RepID=A0A0D1DXP7_MYCMD|nr:uncharacterized protein UMAG_12264 [Ustilago maydis 521]KIS67285.1 hypothetical protein UMAG_12264 [Ustilago maydis 521]|eukprot:XP_011391213.1 hypothetical protein UMAG_12264 [Ustilago maydis 521]
MLSVARSTPAMRAKERIVAWILLLLHALVLALSVLLLLSPNTLFNSQSGLASVGLDTGALFASSALDTTDAPRRNATAGLDRPCDDVQNTIQRQMETRAASASETQVNMMSSLAAEESLIESALPLYSLMERAEKTVTVGAISLRAKS